uniref:Uncharacterized protein n=2 Tax=Sphaerodactylus townsendi TaxID=933632 RepID=A0ACB8EGG6_9SAUR
MTVVEGLVTAVTSAFNSFTNLLQSKFGRSTEDGFAAPNPGSPLPDMRICSFSSMILNYASGLKNNVVKHNRINFEQVYDKRTGQVKTNYVKTPFLQLKNDISKEENCQAKEKALDVVLYGIHICEQLEHMAKSAAIRKEEEAAIVQKIKNLYQQAAAFDSYSNGVLKSPAFTPKSPNMAQCQQESTGGSVWMRNAHLKVEQGREMYRATQEEYQKSFENFKKQNKELADILCQMENCRVREIDFEAALKMLAEGLKAMGKVKEQWGKMILFFEMISNIIDVRLNQKISDCLEFVSDVQQIKGYSSNSFVTDTIYNHVFSASAVAHLVHMIAETYTELSHKYLMDRVSSLGTLLTLESTDPEFNSERMALSQGCEEARKAIYNMVVQKKKEFDRDLLARMQTMEREMKAVLPPISVEEKKIIEQAVHDGRKELTAWEEDQFV